MSSSETLNPSITAESDLYGLLGISIDSQESDIRRAYRRVALKYHPDKNPTEEAKVKFHNLNLALETLVSKNLRKIYDQLRKSWIEKEARKKELDDNRRKLQQDLEDKEKQVIESLKASADSKRKLEILKMEGLKKRRLHEEKMERKRAVGGHEEKNKIEVDEEDTTQVFTEAERTVKLRIRQTFSDLSEGRISKLLSIFGTVEHVAIVPAMKGRKFFSVLVVFEGIDGAQLCASKDFESMGGEFKAVKSASLLNSGGSDSRSDSIDRNRSDYAEATMRRLEMLSKNRSG